MRFLIDRCVGMRLAQWLKEQGHDVSTVWDREPDPGDQVLLEWALNENRILVTIDTDFGKLIFFDQKPSCGLIRLPDVPAKKRIALLEKVLTKYSDKLESGAIITIGINKVRVSYPIMSF